MSDRVQIYIDGSNFHHLALKPIGAKEIDFDFDAFINSLADGRAVSEGGKRYYVGTVREKVGDERSKHAMAKQVQFFTKLKKTTWVIKTSKLRERRERIVIDERVENYKTLKTKGINEIIYYTFREKGIDVKIATDLVAGAIDNKYDTAILISSDTDLVPMVDWIRFRFNKKIEYIGFSIPDKTGKGNDVKPTHALISRTDIQRVFVESDLQKFIPPTQPTLKEIV